MQPILDLDEPTQWIKNPYAVTEHPRQINVDLGRPSACFMLSIRQLIHWTAYRFDTGFDDGDVNHHQAMILRAIAEDFYPSRSNVAEYICGEFVEDRSLETLQPANLNVSDVDVRLLELSDGLAVCHHTFAEAVWSDQQPTPALARNAQNYFDVQFPPQAFEKYGVKGLRLYTLDVIHFIKSSIDLEEMSYQGQEAWLDALDLSRDRQLANQKFRLDADGRAKYGDHGVDWSFSGPSATTSPEEADSILQELDGLV